MKDEKNLSFILALKTELCSALWIYVEQIQIEKQSININLIN